MEKNSWTLLLFQRSWHFLLDFRYPPPPHRHHHQKYQRETPTMMMSMYRYVCLFTYSFMCPYRDIIIIILRTAILFGLVFFGRRGIMHCIGFSERSILLFYSSFFISLHTIVLVIIISPSSPPFYIPSWKRKAKRFSFFTEMQ